MNFLHILEEYRQRLFLITLSVVVIAGLVVVWYVYFRDVSIEQIFEQPDPPRAVRLNFEVFESPAFLELGSDPRDIPVEEGPGRENPFATP